MQKQLENVLCALMPENRLVARMAIATGLRVGDILSLKSEKLAQRMTVKEAKTGKRRQIYIPSKLLADLRANSGEIWVFEGRDKMKHRTRQAVWKDVKRASKAFRLPQNVAPHSFRKVYAVDLMRKYGDIERVRKTLGHTDAAVTMLYAMADKLLQNDR